MGRETFRVLDRPTAS